MDKIWDSHIHLFTAEMAAEPGSWALARRETVWGACVAPAGRPSIQGWSTPEALLRDMDEAGLEQAVLLGWYWETPESCGLQNRFYAGLLRKYPDRLKAFAALQPRDPEVLDEIDRARDEGFSGLGEIHPQAQGFSLEDPCWEQVLNHIAGSRLPVNLHVTDPDSGAYPGKVDTPLEPYLEMARAWPEQVFILAHLGGGIPWKHRKQLVGSPFHNLFFDCAAAPLLYPREILPRAVESLGAEKLLFGSDYPLRVFPKWQKRAGFCRMRDWVMDSGLTEAELSLVLWENAKRLF